MKCNDSHAAVPLTFNIFLKIIMITSFKDIKFLSATILAMNM